MDRNAFRHVGGNTGVPVPSMNGRNTPTSDLSISGVSFLAESNGAPLEKGWLASTDDLIRRKVRVTIPAEDFSIAISGLIVRQRNVWVHGHKTQSLGIEFAKMPPRLRGAFFAFAENAKDADRPFRP